MKTYYSITLGPIYKTISQQRRTRSLFAASYLFSYIMRFLMRFLVDKGLKDQILLPSPDFLDDPRLTNPRCGFYHDRLILEGNGEDLTHTFQSAIIALFDHLGEKFEGTGVSQDYLDQYLSCYFLKIQLPQNESLLETINAHLDQLEMVANFPFGPDEDPLQKVLSDNTQNFLLLDALGPEKEELNQGRFRSVGEIASTSLERFDSKTYQTIVRQEILAKMGKSSKTFEETDEFYGRLAQEFRNDFQDYHKYIAIVSADGDNFGKHIQAMGGERQKLQKFHHDILAFGIKARDTILEYGGSPVFIGGDDLLFFAPVACIENNDPNDHPIPRTIFSLIKTLDDLFYKEVGENTPLTFSYGVSISYYKFPLNEALAQADELLEQAKDKHRPENAKRHPNKNTLAFRVTTHSGSYYGTEIDKDRNRSQKETVYKWFLKLLNEKIQGKHFINSLTYKMAFFQDQFTYLLLESPTPEEDMVKNLFNNYLDEPIHNQNRDFINEVAKFLLVVYSQKRQLLESKNYPEAYKNSQEASEDALQTVYSTLRLVNMIRNPHQILEYS